MGWKAHRRMRSKLNRTAAGLEEPPMIRTLFQNTQIMRNNVEDNRIPCACSCLKRSECRPASPVGVSSPASPVRSPKSEALAISPGNGKKNRYLVRSGTCIIVRAAAAATDAYRYGYLVRITLYCPSLFCCVNAA